MSDAPEDIKVIALHTRDAWQPPEPAPEPECVPERKGGIDQHSVESLNDALEAVIEGDVVGVCIMGFDSLTGEVVTWTQFEPGWIAKTAAMRSLGGLEILKDALMGVYEFGLNPVDMEAEADVLGDEPA